MISYRCLHCNHVFSDVKGVIPAACPKCGSLYFFKIGGR